MCLAHSKAKLNLWSLEQRKVLLQGHARRQGGSYPEKPGAPQGFQQSIFKSQVKVGGHGIPDQILQFSDWLMMREEGASQGLTSSVLGLQEACGCDLLVLE